MQKGQVQTFLSEILCNIHFDYEKCLQWITNLEIQFGYISIAQYIRVIEMLVFTREMKDELLALAFHKMNYSNYEYYFEECVLMKDLYQKIFLLMMVDFVADYLRNKTCRSTIHKDFIIWEVIARFYLEEHLRIEPHDLQFDDFNEHSAKHKIYRFFLNKNIDIQAKIDFHQNKLTYIETLHRYFSNYLNL